MLHVQNLSKTYPGGLRALQRVSLDVSAGMFGLLGPNGAGKSSLMRTLATLQLPDSGAITFDGIDVLADPYALRRRLGYLPQSFGAYPFVGCRTLLRHMAILKGLPDDRATAGQIDELLEITNLTAHASRRVTNFSGGMRQRFGIAQALLGRPDLLILDEPTAGLDPEERTRLYNLLSHLSTDRVVLLSTHIVNDIEQLCPRLAIISAGRIIAQGETAPMVRALDGKVWQGEVEAPAEGGALRLNSAYFRGCAVHRYRSTTRPGAEFEPARATLEDVYFAALSDDKSV